jgi:cytochrome c-type biogenesis protein CcmE
MKAKPLYLLGAVLLLGFAGYSLSSFKETLTPYVPYEKARSGERIVQVAGALDKGSSSYVAAQESLYFNLLDPKTHETLRIRYKGLKPANFEDAISIVAIGRYDTGDKVFQADKLLVKCPSKYQGAEVKTYT